MARKQLVKRIEKAKRAEKKEEKLREEEEKKAAEAREAAGEEEPKKEGAEEAEGEEKEEAEEGKEEGEKKKEVKELELPGYAAAPKAKISADVKKALRFRTEKNSRRPYFVRQEAHRYKRLGMTWRRPKGLHSKMRRHWGYRINVVSIGYRGPRAARGLHPSGFKEVRVHNTKDLEAVDPKTQAIRIGKTVGAKKRAAIEDRIKELEKKKDAKYYLLNPLKTYDLVTIWQPSDLEALDRSVQAAIIAPQVGKQVRKAIIAKAKEMSESGKGRVRILNADKELKE